ncbi:MAG: aminotransferase class I/II-fold pyridoxal phosphate-dependent enzyme [Clostridium fessum]
MSRPQGRKFIKLNTNECPYPPSPKVAEAILAGYEENSSKIMPLELTNLRLYSDPEERVLIEAIADHYGVGTNQVIAGNGSDEILGFAFRAFCDQNAPLQFAGSDVWLLSGTLRALWNPVQGSSAGGRFYLKYRTV